MHDPRLDKLARVIVHYSLGVRPGQMVYALTNNPAAAPLMLACYREILQAGGNAYLRTELPGAEEIFVQHAREAELDRVTPVDTLSVQEGAFDAYIRISADANTRRHAQADPARMARISAAHGPVLRKRIERAAQGTYPWVLTRYPTEALAMEADMSLNDYAEFVFAACLLNDPDPVARWHELGAQQQRVCDFLGTKRTLHARGANIDLTLNIAGRSWINCCGKHNLPDGEVFTGPREESAHGWVRYSYPAIFQGREVAGVELTFREGRVTQARAERNAELLTHVLNTDAGARYIGEFAIGTNYGITHPTRDILFDEKIGGTIHIAVGSASPTTGSENESAIHWDMVTDMADAEILADGEVFYRNGRLLI